jgi:hypothetical protein
VPAAEFEPAITSIKRPHTCGLYRKVTEWIYYFNGKRGIGDAREGKRKDAEKNEDTKENFR